MKKILVAFLLLAGIAAAQTYGSFSGVVTGPTGIPVANASVTICHAGAVIIGTDCAQKATIYSSSTGGALANPLTTNANGEFTFYAPPGDYTYSWNGNLYRASVTMAGNPVVAGLTIGSGPAMTQAPVMTLGAFLSGSPGGQVYSEDIISPIKAVYMRVNMITAPAGCTSAPSIVLSQGVNSASLSLVNGTYTDGTAISLALNAGSNLATTFNAGTGCTTNPSNIQITVDYRMQ